MGFRASTNGKQVVLYYDPYTTRGEQTLVFAEEEGIHVTEINLNKNPLDRAEIVELSNALKISIDEMINKEHPEYQEEFIEHSYTPEDWLRVMEENPEMISNPIAIKGRHAILVSTPEDLLKL